MVLTLFAISRAGLPVVSRHAFALRIALSCIIVQVATGFHAPAASICLGGKEKRA
jgi:hypothetical protein